MGADDDPPAVPATVESTLSGDPVVDFAVAFGSRIDGDARSESDLDVAVTFADELSAADRFRERCRLSAAVQRDDAPFVDLSDLDELPLPFAHRAVHGELVCGDEESFRSYQHDIEESFDAQRDGIEQRQRAVVRRIAEEGLRG